MAKCCERGRTKRRRRLAFYSSHLLWNGGQKNWRWSCWFLLWWRESKRRPLWKWQQALFQWLRNEENNAFTFTLHGEGKHRCRFNHGRGSENKSCLWWHHGEEQKIITEEKKPSVKCILHFISCARMFLELSLVCSCSCTPLFSLGPFIFWFFPFFSIGPHSPSLWVSKVIINNQFSSWHVTVQQLPVSFPSFGQLYLFMDLV